MLLHFEKYCEQHPEEAGNVSYYHKLPEYLHKMNVSDILKQANRFGRKKLLEQCRNIKDYLRWLHTDCGVDMTDKLYDLERDVIDFESDYIGFFSLPDLRKGIEDSIMSLEVSDRKEATYDYDGLYCVFYLEWYGIEAKSIASIMLEDVTAGGHKVYVPAEQRTVEIDDEYVASRLWEYKYKTESCRENHNNPDTLKGDTFFRTTKPAKHTFTQIRNAKNRFIDCVEDQRFTKHNVYESGRLYQMFLQETKGVEFNGRNIECKDVVRQIFNDVDMSKYQISQKIALYKQYKKTLIKYI